MVKIVTKHDYGLLWCETCGREWAWKNRDNSLNCPQCEQRERPPVPPKWVQNDKLRGDLFVFSPISQLVPPEIVIPNPVPTRHLVGKQSCPSRATTPAHVAAASSSDLPRTGVG